MKLRRTTPHEPYDPVFITVNGERLKASGLYVAIKRLGQRADIHLSVHMLRRTFATLSLRAGINPIHLQALMGHASLEMTRQYIQMVEDDLVEAYREHGPVDRFVR